MNQAAAGGNAVQRPAQPAQKWKMVAVLVVLPGAIAAWHQHRAESGMFCNADDDCWTDKRECNRRGSTCISVDSIACFTGDSRLLHKREDVCKRTLALCNSEREDDVRTPPMYMNAGYCAVRGDE